MGFGSRALTIAILGLTGLSTTRAQQLAAPNPIDVRAAYCVEIVKEAIRTVKQVEGEMTTSGMTPIPVDDPRYKQQQDALLADTAKLRMLKRYLSSRLPHIDVAGIRPAQRAAKHDNERIDSTANRCFAQCPGSLRCEAACATRLLPPQELTLIQKRMEACDTVDWLHK